MCTINNRYAFASGVMYVLAWDDNANNEDDDICGQIPN